MMDVPHSRFLAAVIFVLLMVTANHGISDLPSDSDHQHDEHKFHKFSYEHYQLWKAYANDSRSIEVLKRMEEKRWIAAWNVRLGSHADILVNLHWVDEVQDTLRTHRIKFKVSLENVQKEIDRGMAKEHEHTDKHMGYAMNWKMYHRLETIYGYLWHLQHKFPDLCSVQSIGTTAENREILMIRIANGKPNNKRIWIDGGMHGREWIASAAAAFIIHHIVHEPHKQRLFLKDIDWYIVPVLNPDGYEYSHTSNRLWRKNRSKGKHRTGVSGSSSGGVQVCYGVDLNKNFGYQWQAHGNAAATASNPTLEPCSGRYRGPTPFSERETAAVAKFFLKNADSSWQGFINLHSYGQQIVYPWGVGEGHVDNEDEMRQLALKAANKIAAVTGSTYDVGQMSQLFAGAAGSITDWARSTAGIKYTFLVELRDVGQYGYLLPTDQIYAACREAWLAVETIAEAAVS